MTELSVKQVEEDLEVEPVIETKKEPVIKEKVTESVAKENPVIEKVKIQEATVAENNKVITGPKKVKPVRSSNMQAKSDNTLGSRAADNAFKKIIVEEKPKDDNKVALWSNKNIRWTGIGSLSKGYNIVTKEASEKWLNKDGIRSATPEEVATYFGK
jgi:hypothetical protein